MKEYDLPIGRYEWKINDINLINKIKNAQIGNQFDDKPFKMHGLKLHLSLNLLSIPPKLSQISAKIKIIKK